jgi:uncharacterized protein YeaO (DUF488 family)
MKIQIKRVYEPASPADGYRILVDRIWPRGVSKEHAALDEWLRDIAPSSTLRRWFGHEPAKWTEFKRRYFEELGNEPGATAIAHVQKLATSQQVSLLFAAKDELHNQAVALGEYLAASGKRRV